jgi:hypothetical protein
MGWEGCENYSELNKITVPTPLPPLDHENVCLPEGLPQEHGNVTKKENLSEMQQEG